MAKKSDIKAQQRIAELQQAINEHDYKYYVLAQPSISDKEYDMLMKELQELEAANPDLVTPDSPTQRVSGEPTKLFPPAKHKVPMLSLSNSYNAQEVTDFAKRVSDNLGHEPRTRRPFS